MDLPILILAAGQSSRMRGTDKLLEIVDGLPLLQRQAIAALEVSRRVYVALPDQTHPRAKLLQDTDAKPIFIADSADGMAHSLRGGVQALPDCSAFMIVLPDLVGLRASDLQTIIDARRTAPSHLIWRGATQTGKPGHPIIFDAKLRPAFAQLHGDTGGAPILKRYKDQTHLVRLSADRALRDLDTPEDWARWRAETQS